MMDAELIERVAEALANQIAMRKGCPPIRGCLAIMPADMAEVFRDDARTAIEVALASRDPEAAKPQPTREHVMPGDPPHLLQTALQWWLKFEFGAPHTVRESNVAVEAFKDGYRAALGAANTPEQQGDGG